MHNYPWAVSHAKLSAAILHVKAYGEITDEAVKVEYIRRGGLVKEVLNDSPVASAAASTTETTEVVTPKPVRRGRRASTTE